MTTIEKLAQKYFEATGDSPEYSFWGWLDAIGVPPVEEELLDLLNDTEYWENMKGN
jgi:hypothetical protein